MVLNINEFITNFSRVDPFNNHSCNPSTTLSTENIYRNYMNGVINKYSVKVKRSYFSSDYTDLAVYLLHNSSLTFFSYSRKYYLKQVNHSEQVNSPYEPTIKVLSS